jgi:hypothetical protein
VAGKVNAEAAGLLPEGVVVNWLKESDPESFVKEGKVVLRLGFLENRDKQFAAATMQFVAAGLVATARPYVAASVMKGSDLVLTRRILALEKDGALPHFLTSIYEPALHQDPDLQTACAHLSSVDDSGLFTSYSLENSPSCPIRHLDDHQMSSIKGTRPNSSPL